MKKLTILAAIAILSVACVQKTEREVGNTQTTETTTVTTTATVDTAAVEDAARDAAHKTGTAMETAGQEIQEQTKTDTTATK